MKRIALVNTLAAQLRRADSTLTRSTSMKRAFATLDAVPSAKLLTFTKKGSTAVERRVVCENWAAVQAPKGGRSTISPLQKVFADLAKPG